MSKDPMDGDGATFSNFDTSALRESQEKRLHGASERQARSASDMMADLQRAREELAKFGPPFAEVQVGPGVEQRLRAVEAKYADNIYAPAPLRVRLDERLTPGTWYPGKRADFVRVTPDGKVMVWRDTVNLEELLKPRPMPLREPEFVPFYLPRRLAPIPFSVEEHQAPGEGLPEPSATGNLPPGDDER